MIQLEKLLKNENALAAMLPLKETLAKIAQILAELLDAGVAVNVSFIEKVICVGKDEEILRDITTAYLQKKCRFIEEPEKAFFAGVKRYSMETAEGTRKFLVIPAEMNTQRVGEIIIRDRSNCSEHCQISLKLVSLIIFLLVTREKTIAVVKNYIQDSI